MTAATDIKHHLTDLFIERASAVLAEDPAYLQDLDAEIEATRTAYVGAAVSEIAWLRASMDGRLQG